MTRTGRPPTIHVKAGQRLGHDMVIDPDIRVALPGAADRQSRRGAMLRCDCGCEFVAMLSDLTARPPRVSGGGCKGQPFEVRLVRKDAERALAALGYELVSLYGAAQGQVMEGGTARPQVRRQDQRRPDRRCHRPRIGIEYTSRR